MAATILRAIVPGILVILSMGIKAQDTIIKSINSDFMAEIHRDSAGITVFISLAEPSRYSSVVVEQGRWKEGEFRQCAAANLKSQDTTTGPIESKITYPLSPESDSYYRIKTVTTDGDEATYPPILLPAKEFRVPKFHIE